MASSSTQPAFPAITEGYHGRGKMQGVWGHVRGVPKTCGKPIRSRPGHPACDCVPTWFQNGVWSCGLHRADKSMPRGGPNVLPPSVAGSFTPFECAICMDECTHVSDSYTTPCNHRFHTGCMTRWANSSTSGVVGITCPMCRARISITRVEPPPPPPPVREGNNDDLETMIRIELILNRMDSGMCPELLGWRLIGNMLNVELVPVGAS